ncbi:MAG: TIGR02186 family protein [Rhodobacteraceae bacterium]|nr:TIGR02186 family protein [Paracoccaceae bacterium]
MLRIIIAATLWIATPLLAQESVVVDLSQNKVEITTTFSGSNIFVFGAVKRDTPLPAGTGPLDVAIVVEGPLETVTVRKKEKKFGIWVNAEAIEIQEAPSFFTIATTRPLSEMLNEGDLRDYAIGLNYAVRPQPQSITNADTESFSEAIIRIRTDNGLYSERVGLINLTEDTLFEADIRLPANLVEGDYTARVYLVRDKNIVADASVGIVVRKAGLEAWLYNLSRENALLYGLLSILVALAAGYGASEIFRRLRR